MQVVWELDNLEQLGDNKLDVSGRPAVIAGPYGPAILLVPLPVCCVNSCN